MLDKLNKRRERERDWIAIVETRHAEEWEKTELNASVKCQKW